VTIRILASPHIEHAVAARSNGGLGLALYHVGRPALAGIGHTLLHEVKKLPQPPSVRAWDLLSIALAVYGTDRFIPRRDSPDGWTRILALEVEVVEPDPWSAQAAQLADALRFLTGDIWYLGFRAGGQQPPNFTSSSTDRDCACLFSGGLDSLIGAIDLTAAGRRPLLVSQASPKEGKIQRHLANRIDLDEYRFQGRVTERAAPPYEPSSRARSVLFFAYGALAAAGLGGELFVPENGLISINPPLTRRRIGSLSTRTTHPHFVSSLQAVFDHVGLGITMTNPYTHKTKGEMLAQCGPISAQIASASYSCGKGKRLNKHCGRCVPCLIRRAAFFKAKIADSTDYAADNLARHATNDDVYAARLATAALAHRDIARWAAEAGPLPTDLVRRTAHVDVVRRGLEELRDYLGTVAWP
jgi:hypothetical protein